LLAEWLAAAPTGRSVAWLSLEESDRQPALFWTYLLHPGLLGEARQAGASTEPQHTDPNGPSHPAALRGTDDATPEPDGMRWLRATGFSEGPAQPRYSRQLGAGASIVIGAPTGRRKVTTVSVTAVV